MTYNDGFVLKASMSRWRRPSGLHAEHCAAGGRPPRQTARESLTLER
jgi:hypothetical protein